MPKERQRGAPREKTWRQEVLPPPGPGWVEHSRRLQNAAGLGELAEP